MSRGRSLAKVLCATEASYRVLKVEIPKAKCELDSDVEVALECRPLASSRVLCFSEHMQATLPNALPSGSYIILGMTGLYYRILNAPG